MSKHKFRFEALVQTVRLSTFLGWQDVKQAYRRSALGPFWLTLGMAVQIGTMGAVFAVIFKVPMESYFPFLATSVIVWSLISGAITEGGLSFIAAESLIKQLKLPPITHVLRSTWKQLVIFGHNVLILPLVFIAVLKFTNFSIILLVPGLLLLILNLVWISLVLGIVSARFRDIPQATSSIMTILYFVSPVMWQPSLIPPDVAHYLLGLNPIYHLLQLVRLPILGQLPTAENWFLSAAFALVGWTGASSLIRKYQNQIAYWV